MQPGGVEHEYSGFSEQRDAAEATTDPNSLDETLWSVRRKVAALPWPQNLAPADRFSDPPTVHARIQQVLPAPHLEHPSTITRSTRPFWVRG